MASVSEKEAIELVRRHYTLLNEGDIDGAFALMSPDIQTHSVMTMKGVDMLKHMTSKARDTFEDFKEEVEDIFACGDRVCVRGVRKGKFTNQFGNLKPTGKEIATSWIAVNRVENDLIVERWLNHDDLGFLQSVGMMGGGHGNSCQSGKCQHNHGGQGAVGQDAPEKPFYPVSPSEITLEWLNQALGKGGHLKSAKVKSFTTEEGAPLSATELVAHLKLEYEGVPGSPNNLVARFPTTNQMARQIFRQAQTHVRAVRFFEQLAPRGKGISLPKAFFTLSAAESGDFVIVHEDVESKSTRLTTIEGASLEDAQTIVQKLGIFHAQWWKDGSDCKGLEWLKTAPASELTYLQLFETSWRFLATNYPLSADIKGLGDSLGKKLAGLYTYHRTLEPFTVCHNNLSPSSLLRGLSGEWSIDTWNEVSLGKGARDVASFLCQSLAPAVRKNHESDLLRIYHQTLLENGVTGYKFQRCWYDYKVFVLLSFAQFVCNGAGLFVMEQQGKLSPSQKPKLGEFKVIFSRLEAALLDLECSAILSDFKLK